MKTLFTSLLVSGLLFALAGCASLQNEEPAAKMAIQAATLKVIDGDTERAQRVHSIADEVIGLVGGDSEATLDVVEERVRDEIRWDRLDQAEQLVASNLVDAVRAEIEARIEGGALDPGDRVAVQNVMEWIRDAAAMAGGGSGVDATQTADRSPSVSVGRKDGSPHGPPVGA